MPDIGTMHQLNPEPPHIGTMHQIGPEPLHTGEIITPQAQAEEYAREAQESAANAALSAAAAQSAAETAQQAAESIAPALDEKADAIHTAAGPAPIVSIPDAAAAPVDALTVGIEPVQDLHGYDNPWPAGGGKNIFYHEGNLTATVNGLTATFDGDSQTVSITGTNTGTSAYVLLSMACTGDIPRETPLARALINAPSGVYANFVYRKNRTWVGVNNGNVIPVDIDEGTDITFQIGILTSVTTLNANGIHVQIERGSTAPTAWTPYSNICPISGWTGAKVYHSGEDTSNPTELDITFPTEAGTVYGGTLDLVRGKLVVDAELEVFDRIDSNSVLSQINLYSSASGSAQTVGDVTRISFSVKSGVDQSKYNRVSSSYTHKMCNYARHYFAYNDSTVHWYRNTVLYVFLPTALVGSTSQSVYDYLVSIKDTAPLSLWIPLATPITYTLTPQEIRTLLGANNIWADTGDVTVGYKADTKLYIDKKFAELQALILEH